MPRSTALHCIALCRHFGSRTPLPARLRVLLVGTPAHPAVPSETLFPDLAPLWQGLGLSRPVLLPPSAVLSLSSSRCCLRRVVVGGDPLLNFYFPEEAVQGGTAADGPRHTRGAMLREFQGFALTALGLVCHCWVSGVRGTQASALNFCHVHRASSPRVPELGGGPIAPSGRPEWLAKGTWDAPSCNSSFVCYGCTK